MSNLIENLMDYESGELSIEETFNLFAELIKSGTVWSLQGHYGRTASSLIDEGLITPKGDVVWSKVDGSFID